MFTFNWPSYEVKINYLDIIVVYDEPVKLIYRQSSAS